MPQREKLLADWNNGILNGAQTRLAKATGISIVSINKIFRGVNRPSYETIKKFASVFGKTEEELEIIFETRDKKHKFTPVVTASPVEYVPMLGQACASRFKCIVCEQEPELFLPIRRDNRGDYSLQIVGDCMEPAIKEADYVIVRPTKNVQEGDVVLARMGEDCTIKRIYFKVPNIICLVPDNSKYDVIEGTLDEIEIMGKIMHVHNPVKRKPKRPDFLDK